MRAAPIINDDCREIVDGLGDLLGALAGGTLLVTGAAGFLCSYFVDVAVEHNRRGVGAPIRVIAVDNFLTGTPDRLAHLQDDPNVALVSHDITQPLPVAGPVDWIIHGASIASPSVYRRFPLETLDANVTGTRLMLELAREKSTKGVILMSSSEIYGDPDPAHIPTPETYRGNVACMGPRACYDESKRMSETLGWVFSRTFGLKVCMIRPFNVFGPGFRLDDQRVLPDFFSAVLQDKPIALLSDGRPSRTFCYVTDAVRGVLSVLVAGEGGEAYNVGNDEGEISMRDLAARVSAAGAEVTRRAPVSVSFASSADADYLTDNPQRRAPDLAKLRSVRGWAPRISLDEGLRRTLLSYQQIGVTR